jgi:16S rRNA (uracil1498-N3)-methyltransferase
VNLILLFPEDFITETRVRLQGRRLNHVLAVHRATAGDELRVGMVNGLIGAGTVLRLDPSALEMDVRLERKPPDALPVTLVLALPRPKVLRRVLRAATVMGVKRTFLVNAYRVEKSYWQSPFLKSGALQEQLALGLEQAGDTVIPEVVLRSLFKPFVEDELPAIIKGTLALVGHPTAGDPFPRNVSGPVTLAVGPEGGFIPYELEALTARGFRPVTFGERILNVETVVPALLSRIG